MDNNQKNKESKEINILDTLVVLAGHKTMIVRATLAITAIAAIISFLVTPKYTAETQILPPQQASGMSSQLQALGQQAGMVGAGAMGLSASALGIKNPGDMYVGELKSTTIADNVIKKFDLAKLYDKDYPEDVRKKLARNVSIQSDKKSGIIAIEVTDEDPKRAADMANTFVTELKELNKDMSSTEAAERKTFFDARLTEVKASLSQAETNMKNFQEKTGIIKLDAQVTATIEGIAALKAQIASEEVEMRVVRTYATAQNPDVKRAEKAVQGMRAQLAQLEAKSNHVSAIVPTGNIPSAGTEYLQRLRELKFNEALYELLLKQYEAAKLDEGKNPVAMQVVDYAKPPVKKSSPQRLLITVSAFILALCTSCCAAMFIEYKVRMMNDPVNAQRMAIISQSLSLKRGRVRA